MRKDIRIGDIVCFRKPKGRDDGIVGNAIEFIQERIDGETIHVAPISSKLGDNYFTVQVDAKGVTLNYKQALNSLDIAVVRPIELRIYPAEFNNAVNIWYSGLPKDSKTGKPDYDFFGAFRVGLLGFLSNLTGGRLWRRTIIKDNPVPFCSEAIAEIYYKLSQFRFIDKVNGMALTDENVLPHRDVYSNRKQFFVVKDYGEKL